MKRIRPAFFLLALAWSAALQAQVTTGTISGTVADSTGAVLPGTKVTVLNEETGITRTAQTDAAGRYSAPLLSLGNYKVTASLEGFQSEVRSGIVLTVGREAVVNFQLNVGAVTQSVEVSGEAPLVNTTGGGLGEVVESHTITELPLNGRDLSQLITLETGATTYTAPGSSDTGAGKLIVIAGQRPTSNVFLIDGIPIESYSDKTPTGASGSFLGVDAVREFKVETNAYNAEFGRGSGGIFNMATASGTNRLHGSLFEYLRNDKLDAAKWEDNKFGAEKPAFKRNQFGGSLGGPIKKDHTFFFGTYEGYRERLGQTITTTTFTDKLRQGFIPNATTCVFPANPTTINASVLPYLALYPRPNGDSHCDGTADYSFDFSQPTNEDTFQVRIDHTLGEKDTLFGRYTYLNSNEDTLANNPGFENNLIPVTIRNQYIALGENRIFSANLLNSFRFGFTRTLPVDGAKEVIPVDPKLYWVPTVPQLGTLTVTGLGTVGNGIVGDSRTVNSFQFLDDITLTKGRHSFKFGGYFDRVQFNGWNPARDAGNYSFGSITSFFQANPRQFRGSISIGFNDAFRSFRQSIAAVYLQDDIKVTPRLTLNAGLRYEFVTIPSENYGRVGNLRGDIAFMLKATANDIKLGNPWIDNPSLKNFAPRIGFAWDVFGDSKTAVRGGFGIFFQQVDQSWMRTSGFRMPPFLVEQQASTNVPFPNIYGLCANDNPITPKVAACSGVRPTPDFVAYNTRTPYAEQYNFSIQRQLNASTVLSAGYVGTGGIDLPGVANLNMPQGQIVNGRLFFDKSLTLPNPNFNQIRYRYGFSSSRYNSLQVAMNEKVTKGLQFRASYTWSRSIDIISGSQTASDTGAGPNWVPYYYQPSLYRGLSAFDQRNVFTFSSTYELPFGPGKRFGGSMSGVQKAIFGGWDIGGILSLANGFPATANITPPLSGLGFQSQTPDLVAGASNNPTRPRNTDQYFDPASFAFPATGFLGTLGRNTLIMPGLANLDFTLHKNASITEALKLQLRFEFFNILNHANFGVPALTVFDNSGKRVSTAGQITTTSTKSRQIQLALRLVF